MRQPAPPASSPHVRKRMQAVGRRDTALELAVRSRLHGLGLRYFVDRAVPPLKRRRVDLVFPRSRVAVFLDGCFWHGCDHHGRRIGGANPEYWAAKIERNQARDRETTMVLEEAGWRVLRFWEHDDPVFVADEIATRVSERRLGIRSP